jgi:hypothetical protein
MRRVLTAVLLAALGSGLGGCSLLWPRAPAPATPIVAGPAPAEPTRPSPAPPRAPRTPPPVVVKAPCVPRSFPRAPRYPDSDAALRNAGGAADRYQLMAAGRILRDQRLAELERMIDACR